MKRGDGASATACLESDWPPCPTPGKQNSTYKDPLIQPQWVVGRLAFWFANSAHKAQNLKWIWVKKPQLKAFGKRVHAMIDSSPSSESNRQNVTGAACVPPPNPWGRMGRGRKDARVQELSKVMLQAWRWMQALTFSFFFLVPSAENNSSQPRPPRYFDAGQTENNSLFLAYPARSWISGRLAAV